MKKQIIHLAGTMLLFFIPVISIFADPPDPPILGGSPAGNYPPVGAPLDSGYIILLAFGVMYGAWTLYREKRKKLLEDKKKCTIDL